MIESGSMMARKEIMPCVTVFESKRLAQSCSIIGIIGRTTDSTPSRDFSA